MSDFAERLQIAIKQAGLTPSKVATEIDLSAQAPQKWKKGQISLDTLIKIIELTGTDANWLLRGDKAPIPTHQKLSVQMNGNTVTNGSSLHQNIDAQRQLEEQMIRSGQQCTDIVYYEHADLTQQSTIAIAQGVINRVPDILRSPDELFAFPMTSQDMTPIITGGSLVVVDIKKARIPIYDGKIYALKMGNLVRCFYLSQISADEVKVYSSTDKNGEVLKRADFDNKYQIMGGVVWWSSFMEW
ncbi:S24 family peptidase [Moraxella sp. ZY200743]|uniref:S24 family peptidase n=1 Tax=Moraxella sp. ZY200743 TaxID=2911970 RepID=UPI003D7DFFAC